LALLSGSSDFVVTAISQRVCHVPANPCRAVIGLARHVVFQGLAVRDVANP